MSEQPLTRGMLASVLADFHRDLIAPDSKRVFERLDRMDARFDELEEKYPLRAEVQDLKSRVELLHEDVRRLEQRLKT